MDWLRAEPGVGPTARVYTLPEVSVTELTAAVASFQPTTTTFRFPAVCAAVNVTDTLATEEDCGMAELTWTNVGVATCGGVAAVVALATFEYPLRLPAASVARTR